MLEIKNKSDKPINVLWDETFFIDQNNERHRVIHSGVTHEDRFKPQDPSIIKPDSSLIDDIYPVTFIDYNEEVGWRNRPFFPWLEIDSYKLEKQAKSLIGKTIRVILALEIEGARRDYTFTFTVVDARVKLYDKSLHMMRK